MYNFCFNPKQCKNQCNNERMIRIQWKRRYFILLLRFFYYLIRLCFCKRIKTLFFFIVLFSLQVDLSFLLCIFFIAFYFILFSLNCLSKFYEIWFSRLLVLFAFEAFLSLIMEKRKSLLPTEFWNILTTSYVTDLIVP